MEEIPQPTPIVFRVRTTDSMLLVGCLTCYLSILLGMIPGMMLSQLIFGKEYHPGQVGFTTLASAIIFFFGYRYSHRRNNTKARIEIQGNTIWQFDEQGAEISKGDLNDIAVVYRAQKPVGRQYLDYFHILFRSGELVSFNQYLENDFVLKKKLKTRTQRDFIRIEWSYYETLLLDSKQRRAIKASQFPKHAIESSWNPSPKDY